MSQVECSPDFGTGIRHLLVWRNVSTAGGAEEKELPESGFYNLSVHGTFGNATARFLAGFVSGPTRSFPVDAAGTEWSATAPTGPFLVGPLAKGMIVRPSLSGGTGDSVTFTLAYAGK